MEPLHFSISSQFLTTFGVILLAGLMLSALGQRSFLPRATLLLIFGALIGSDMLDLLPGLVIDQFTLVADLTLLMVGFLLGGAWLGSRIAGPTPRPSDWLGAALLPQAGIAIGMALVASNHFPHYQQIMLPMVIASTIIFEIVGPVFTRYAVRRSASVPE